MLIDGHALAYRAYHAIPPLTNDAGEPTNATFGYINMLMKAIQDYAPDYVVATFDAGKTFRHEEYVEYKATRAATPDDMRVQMGRIHEFTTAMGIPIYEKPGFEADDLLGTLALQASRQGLETIIVTGDSDTFQLITDTVKVLTPRRTFGEIMLYDETAVRERYQLEPRQLIDFKALKGDSSDNIPGVKGIGEKSALALLQQFRTLEGIYAHLDEVTPARAQKALTEGRDDAFRSQHLVTIVQDVDVRLDLEHSEWGAFDRGQVLERVRELGFRTLAERIPQPRATLGEQLDRFGRPAEPAAAEPKALGDYRVVNTPETLAAMTAALNGAPRLALDTETTGVDPMRDELVGISLCAAAGTAYYLPVGHRQRLEEEPQLRLDEVRPVLAPILADAATLKVMHNAKFDMMVLAQHGLPVQGPLFDTMLAAWLLAPSGRGIGLKEQAFERLGVEMTNIQELIGRGAKRRNMDEVAISQAAPYAAADADMTFQLGEQLGPELRQRGQWALFDGLEMPLLPVLLEMETHGMAVDAELLQRMSKEMGQRLAELNAQICDLAGHSFQHQFAQATGRGAFRGARAAGGPAHRHRLFHRRGRVGGAARQTRHHRFAARIPPVGQVAWHLRGRPAGTDQSAHGARAHLVQPDGHQHRAALLQRP
jgi:DNA polymerase-1